MNLSIIPSREVSSATVAAGTAEGGRAARVYPLAFVGWGLAAEAGLLVCQSAVNAVHGPLQAVLAEVSRDGFSYGYLAVAIAVGLGLLGRSVGKREDLLRETSVTDSLTRVINRRGVDDALCREVARAQEARMPLALLVLDIDHFKRLNDELGHQAGDLALQRLGEVLRATCRSRDVPGRLGGDEFVVILPRTTADEAEVLAERIRDTLATHRFTSAWRAGLDRVFELSIGVASLDDVSVHTPAALLQAADRALYQAKADGRNRVARSIPSLRLVTPMQTQCAAPVAACPHDANHAEEVVPRLGGYDSCANSNAENLLRTPPPLRAPTFSESEIVDADVTGVTSVKRATLGAGSAKRRAAT